MATTLNTTAIQNQPTTYTLLVIFTVDERSHDNLQDQQAIRDEAASNAGIAIMPTARRNPL